MGIVIGANTAQLSHAKKKPPIYHNQKTKIDMPRPVFEMSGESPFMVGCGDGGGGVPLFIYSYLFVMSRLL